MIGDDGAAVARVLLELESLYHSDSSEPFSEQSLLDLHSLYISNRGGDVAGDGGGAALWDAISSKSLAASSLLSPITAAMDDTNPRYSLLAARAYLCLLLLPSSPVFSLLSPLSLLSLLRSLRRYTKSYSDPSSASAAASRPPSKKRKASAKPRRSENFLNSEGLLLEVLDLLNSVLSRVQLIDGMDNDCRKSLVDTVAGILTSAAAHRSISDLCFEVLYTLISFPKNQTESSVDVLKSLSAMILSTSKSPERAAALTFVIHQLMPLAKENNEVRKGLIYLPRYLAMKAPERSEPRAAAVEAIIEVVKAMQSDDQIEFAKYVVKMSQGKAQCRLLSVDLILALLTFLPDQTRMEEIEAKCFKTLFQRCFDNFGTIRARALTNMAQLVGNLSGDMNKFNAIQKSAGFGCAKYIELLRERCSDEKAAVRKATLVLITRSITLMGSSIDDDLLRIMGLACSDLLVSIRKAALMALSEAYRRFPNKKVIHEWLICATPLIVDNETSIQEECETLFLELVLDRVSRVSKVTLNDVEMDMESLFPQDVLIVLKEITKGEVAPCIKKICASLGKKRKLKASVANSLQHMITISETMWLRSSKPINKWTAPLGAWQLLAEISCFVTKSIDWKFLHHHWQLLDKDHGKRKDEVRDMKLNSFSWAEDRVALLRTISNVSVELPPEPAADLAHSLLGRIEEFNMHLGEVDAHVKALKTLCKRKATNAEEGNNLVVKWARQLFTKALKILDNYLAELSEICKKDNLFTPPRSGRIVGKKKVSTSESSLQAVIAVFTVGSLVLVCSSVDFQGILPLLYTIITSETSTSKPKKLADFRVPLRHICPSLYIQSWVTLGKICLVDGKLAKRYTPLFVQELERSDCAALRNNIVVVMADFCVRYTSLVDCYIPKITTSLRDPCEVVRRQTFILLSRLLQSDYVKWRGVLFLRFLLCLVDESEKIRALADFLFSNILKAKAPLLAYNSFVEAIFVLNECHTHAQSAMQAPAQSGSKVFSIRGNDNKARSQRMHIYVSLLKQMAPEHLLATSAKLCAEILAAASDGLLNIDDIAGQCVLQDALQLLACKEMRIHPNRGSEAADMEDDGGESGGSAAVLLARGRAVTLVAKKNLIQNAVPIFIELKRLLESKNSPLIGSLMECLRVLLKDYKNEIDEILVADKQLQKELLYDMQKYDAAKAKSTVAEAMVSMQRGDNHLSPETYARVSEKLGTKKKIASAVADAAAKATARTILKELNQNSATPPLRSMSVPKLKSNASQGGHTGSDKSSALIESLRRRQTFESDDEN